MHRASLFAASVLLAISCSAAAHSPVDSTQPANGETLDAVPEMLHVTFARPARVIKVVMMHDGADGMTETRLDVPTNDLVDELHLKPDFPGSGRYSIDWRVLGDDGHVMNGTYSFDVQ